MGLRSENIKPEKVESIETRWREKKEERNRSCLSRHRSHASRGSATVKKRGSSVFG